MADLKVIDILGTRTRIVRVSSTEVVTDEVNSNSKSEVHSTILLPEGRGDYFAVGEPTEQHRRGRSLSWPMEAQSPPGGMPENGNGRVYAEAVLRAFACKDLKDRTFAWRPDGSNEIAVSAEALLGESLKAELSLEAEVGLVVPDGLEENQRQSLIDACALHGKAWIIPRTMAAAIAWCRSNAAAPHLAGKVDENTPIGHIMLIEVGFGPWAVTAVPVFRISTGKKKWLVPKREASLRRVVGAMTGWGLLARQAASSRVRPVMAQMNDPKWVLAILDGKSSLQSPIVNLAMPSDGELPRQPSFGDGLGWDEGFAALMNAARGLMGSLHTKCLGGELIGALAGVKKTEGSLRQLILSPLSLAPINLDDEGVSAGAALAMAGRTNGTPTWFENLETIHLFFKDKNKLGDPVPGWEPLLPGKQMDAGRNYQSEKPIDKFSIPAGRNMITLTLRHTHEEGLTYRQTTAAQSQACKDETPLLISVHAKPGQGFAVVTLKSKTPGLFAGKLDWLKMADCEEPQIKHGYTPTAKLVPVEMMWSGLLEQIEVVSDLLETGRMSEGLLAKLKKITSGLNRCTHSEAAVPDRWRVTGVEKGKHIYFAPVSIEGRAPSAESRKALHRLHELLMEHVVKAEPRGGPVSKKLMQKTAKAASRLMAWNYHGCPDCVKDAAVEKLYSDVKLNVLDLHVLGLTTDDRDHISAFMDRLRRDLPGIKSANNWLRTFRNLVRLNEDALRDVADDDIYEIVEDILPRLEDAIDKERRGIAANCLEALLYVLKRRRYSNGFMSKDGSHAAELIRLVNGGYEVSEDGLGYSESALAFLSPGNRSFVGSLVRFLREDATDADITIGTASGEEEGEEDDED